MSLACAKFIFIRFLNHEYIFLNMIRINTCCKVRLTYVILLFKICVDMFIQFESVLIHCAQCWRDSRLQIATVSLSVIEIVNLSRNVQILYVIVQQLTNTNPNDYQEPLLQIPEWIFTNAQKSIKLFNVVRFQCFLTCSKGTEDQFPDIYYLFKLTLACLQ